MRKVILEEEKQDVIRINDCQYNNIYVFEYNNDVYILKRDDKRCRWYFTELTAICNAQMFETADFHDTIREAIDGGYEVYSFSNAVALFDKWITK